MNWDALGAIAELVGGLAVFLTLGYLSVQVRQTNRQEAAQSVKEAFETFMGAYAALTEDVNKAQNYIAGVNNYGGLDSIQQAMFHSKMQNLANGYYHVWTLHEHGMLADEELFKRCRDTFLTILRTPGALQWWSEWKHLPPQPFINELDALIKDSRNDAIPANEDFRWLKRENNPD
ncbi:MAG: hypothetical protein ACU84Q_13460 [Gammaproteobacteria bacterium]